MNQQLGSASSILAEVDAKTVEMEMKWGIGRLRILVGEELRKKFDNQWRLFNDAVGKGSAQEVDRESRRMLNAYAAADREASGLGHDNDLKANVWEVVLEDDVILTLVRTRDQIARVPRDGFKRVVWCMEEVAQLVRTHDGINKLKAYFPNAYVESIRRAVEAPVGAQAIGPEPDDPLDEINWTGEARPAARTLEEEF